MSSSYKILYNGYSVTLESRKVENLYFIPSASGLAGFVDTFLPHVIIIIWPTYNTADFVSNDFARFMGHASSQFHWFSRSKLGTVKIYWRHHRRRRKHTRVNNIIPHIIALYYRYCCVLLTYHLQL